MYFSLDAMRRGFLDGCRTIIGLDGCFLKTYHGGQLLCAVGRDGNDNLFPIAIAVVPIENREMWTWFVGELLEDIGGVNEQKWTFISDRQKGLLETLKELAPGCAHRFCVRHIYQNFRLKWPSYELKLLLWKAASTGNTREFEKQITEIKKLDSAAANWLMNIPPCHWTRSHFTTSCKSDVLVNNMCESFNNMILQARGKPIISMFEWIRTRMSTRYQTKKLGMEKYIGTLCPSILRKINKYHKLARNCYPRWCGRDEFEVECFMEKYVVYLDKRTCTCGIFQLNGYPCAHAWSCIADRRYKVEDYVDHWYTKEKYMRVYDRMIHAVPGSRDYIKTPYEPLQAPVLKKRIGRPKKMRMKTNDEVQRNGFRSGLTHKCQNCLQLGHNRIKCQNPTHQNSKLYKENSIIEGTPDQREMIARGVGISGVPANPTRTCDQEIMVVNLTTHQSTKLPPRAHKATENSVLASSSSIVAATVLPKGGKMTHASSAIENATESNPKRTRKLKISEVLENIKKNSTRKRASWKI
ncbi:hypothetical protein CASFOL_006133 [Castilleja foliolosa]|uniref:SWIM-type domain-containing protein n=1 Tax=Castilleja foliolosa TaxID=1961234 RepID=A0ABD3E5G2_9LAMI